jgi:peptide deformylase
VPYRLKIITEPDPRLHRTARRMTEKDFHNPLTFYLAEDMVYTTRCENGVGLAACQVGKRFALCVVVPDENEPMVLCNPVLEYGRQTNVQTEGCLSLPGVECEVSRADDIIVHCRNIRGRRVHFEASGFLARVIQHEVDHLNGVLIIDAGRKKISAQDAQEHVEEIREGHGTTVGDV